MNEISADTPGATDLRLVWLLLALNTPLWVLAGQREYTGVHKRDCPV